MSFQLNYFPLQGDYDITSRYGMRWHPIHKEYRLHAGIDIAPVPRGRTAEVLAAKRGKIVNNAYSSTLGYYVDIQHDNTYVTRYQHLVDGRHVSLNQEVAAGAVIGIAGNTGDSTGIHLHFEVRVNGVAEDPEPYLNDIVPEITREDIIEMTKEALKETTDTPTTEGLQVAWNWARGNGLVLENTPQAVSNREELAAVIVKSLGLKRLSGSGTAADPYRIMSGQQLRNLAAEVNSGNSYSGSFFILANDLNLNNIEWIPIGTQRNPFRGNFDGRGHSISGIHIDTNQDYQGLFGYARGIIENVAVRQSFISGRNYIGGIVGWQANDIKNCINEADVYGVEEVGGIAGRFGAEGRAVINCTNKGLVKGSNYVGGAIGRTQQSITIDNCINQGTVEAVWHCGGVLGSAQWVSAAPNSSIKNCENYGTIMGNNVTGGIAGWFDCSSGHIENCINSGKSVTGNGEYTGGIVGSAGYTNAYVSGCKNVSDINGGSYTGGIAGASTAQIKNCINMGSIKGTGSNIGGVLGGEYRSSVNISVTDSANAGNVQGGSSVGGISGHGRTISINRCYSSGRSIVSGDGYAGGVLGYNQGRYAIANSYFLSSSTTKDVGNDGLNSNWARTASQLKLQSTYEGWDFDTIWAMDAETGYPILRCLQD